MLLGVRASLVMSANKVPRSSTLSYFIKSSNKKTIRSLVKLNKQVKIIIAWSTVQTVTYLIGTRATVPVAGGSPKSQYKTGVQIGCFGTIAILVVPQAR